MKVFVGLVDQSRGIIQAKDFANDLPTLKARLTEYLLRAAEPLPDKATREIQVSVARDALQRIRPTAVKRIQ